MKRALTFGAALVFAAGVLVHAAGTGQPSQAFRALTVPAAALPEGCALTPVPAPTPASIPRGGAIIINGTTRPKFPSNPWAGTDRATVAAIHSAIDSPPPVHVRPLPDLPPAAWRSATTNDLKWADNIVDAYHAAYTAVGGDSVEVFAVTFNDLKLAAAPEAVTVRLNPQSGRTTRLVQGATAIRISATTSTTCFAAVRTHIESLK